LNKRSSIRNMISRCGRKRRIMYSVYMYIAFSDMLLQYRLHALKYKHITVRTFH
jgi:hypothetical protein